MITAQYHLSHTDLASILGAFQISYAITWLLGDMLLDAVGTRIGLTLTIIFWSTVNFFRAKTRSKILKLLAQRDEAQQQLMAEIDLSVASFEDVYGSKLVVSLDRTPFTNT